jgi:ABC-type Fe3+-siderophore transport system permease subunit
LFLLPLRGHKLLSAKYEEGIGVELWLSALLFAILTAGTVLCLIKFRERAPQWVTIIGIVLAVMAVALLCYTVMALLLIGGIE